MAEPKIKSLIKKRSKDGSKKDKPAKERRSKERRSKDRFKADPEQIRAIHDNIRKMTKQFDIPGPKMARIEEFEVPREGSPVPVRLYVPHAAETDEPVPTFLFLHGGGFVACNLDSHDGICRRMANGTGYNLVSVDYRLAPDFPYPAGPDDCEHVLNWIMDGHGAPHGIENTHIAIGGDSAGGNMAAYLAQKYRGTIRAQILFYPVMQLVDFKPANPGPQDFLQLGVVALKYIDEHYVQDADPNNTRLSPLFENDLKGMPPAYVLTCGLDPLRDEGKLYADKLQYSGTPVVYHHEKGLPHGFLNFTRAFPKGKKIPLDAADFLRKHINS